MATAFWDYSTPLCKLDIFVLSFSLPLRILWWCGRNLSLSTLTTDVRTVCCTLFFYVTLSTRHYCPVWYVDPYSLYTDPDPAFSRKFKSFLIFVSLWTILSCWQCSVLLLRKKVKKCEIFFKNYVDLLFFNLRAFKHLDLLNIWIRICILNMNPDLATQMIRILSGSATLHEKY
jgi:hypothetical protein